MLTEYQEWHMHTAWLTDEVIFLLCLDQDQNKLAVQSLVSVEKFEDMFSGQYENAEKQQRQFWKVNSVFDKA